MTKRLVGVVGMGLALGLVVACSSDEEDTATDAGAAGTGTGGTSAGTGGSSSGGSPGTGGSPSTGGSPGTGGTAGSAGAGGGALCDLTVDDGGACDTCMETNCLTPCQDCGASADCVAYGECWVACAEDGPCEDQCGVDHPAGLALDDALWACLGTSCDPACS